MSVDISKLFEYSSDDVARFQKYKIDGFGSAIYQAANSSSIPGETFVIEILKMDGTDAGIIGQIWTIFNPLAVALFVIFWLTEFIEKAVNMNIRDMDEKFLISMMLKLIVGVGLMQFGLELIGYILSLGNSLYDEVAKISASGAANPGEAGAVSSGGDELAAYIKKIGLIGQIKYIIPATLKNLITAGIALIIGVNAFSKKLELILMGGFMGVGLSQYFSETGKNGAIRYIKRFVACTLHAVSMIIILRIASILGSNTSINGSPEELVRALGNPMTLVATFMYSMAAIGFMSGAKSVVNDALGV